MLLKASPVRSQTLRRSARGEHCTLRLPGICNGDPATVVLAHLPFGGRGVGLKSSDAHAIYACSACHDRLDGRANLAPQVWPEELYECCIRALAETHERMRAKGLVAWKGAA